MEKLITNKEKEQIKNLLVEKIIDISKEIKTQEKIGGYYRGYINELYQEREKLRKILKNNFFKNS